MEFYVSSVNTLQHQYVGLPMHFQELWLISSLTTREIVCLQYLLTHMKSLPTYCHYLRRDFQVAQNLIIQLFLLQVLLHPQIYKAVIFKVRIRKTSLGVMIISHGKGSILHSYFLQNTA